MKQAPCPITVEDREWLEEVFDWIHETLVDISACPIILPEKKYFPFKFTGDNQTILNTLSQICEYYSEDLSQFVVNLYDEPPEIGEYGEPVGPEWGWQYDLTEKDEPVFVINTRIAKQPDLMIYYLSQALSFHKLFQLDHTGEFSSNEYLWDYTQMAYGFGYFLADQSLNFDTFNTDLWTSGFSWEKRSSLPPQLIAYGLAYLSRFRSGEIPKWYKELRHGMDSDFRKSWKFLAHYLT